MTRYEKGVAGETEALNYLTGLGMECLAKRYRGWDGEIDLVMRDGETLVFVEVKYRPQGQRGDGILSVTPGKQRRMVHAAQAYLAEEDTADMLVRFDVIEITGAGIWHLPDAFRPR